MFKPAVILTGAALFLLAGCASQPNAPEEVITSAPAMTGGDISSLNWTDTNAVRPFPAVRPLRPAARPGPAPAPTPTVTARTSLNRWAAESKISGPQLLSRAPVEAYAVKSENGTLVLDIGSREATWNGAEVNLGFAPQFIDDQVFVHGLDLQKTLVPLLFGQPLSYGSRVVVIDPGHGGVNLGTHSVVDGRYEKEFTLDWALRLAPLLETNGWKVFLTRTGDVDVALSNRVALVEQHHADLFISLHFNSTSDLDHKPDGLETFCLTPAGMPSTLTRGYPDPWTQVFPNNAFDIQNLLAAYSLHRSLLRATGLEDRGVSRARFMGVLHGPRCPAVLIEAGYMSNPREVRLIENPEFRQKLAQAVADALR